MKYNIKPMSGWYFMCFIQIFIFIKICYCQWATNIFTLYLIIWKTVGHKTHDISFHRAVGVKVCVYRLQINLTFIILVSGILLGAINITAPNGELVFPQVQLDYAGHYNLTVFTSNGTDTATYKLVVYGEFREFSKEILLHLPNKSLHWLYCKMITN